MIFIIPVIILTLTHLLPVHAHTEALVKTTGDLYFTENDYILNFELNLTSYFSNAVLLHNNTQILENKCNKNFELTDCKFFRENIKYISDLAARETQLFKTNRSKRAVFLVIGVIATALATLVGSFFISKSVAESVQREYSEQQNIQFNYTQNQFILDENQLRIQNESTNALFERIKNLNEAQYINQLIATTLIAINRHNKDTERFMHALSGEVSSKFFDIINIETFTNVIAELKVEVPKQAMVRT